MKRLMWVVLAVAVAVAPMTGCEAAKAEADDDEPARAAELGESDDGVSVVLADGGTLTIALPGNMTTGYTWLAAETPECLGQVGEAAFEPESDAIGAGGTITLEFEALDPGNGTLELQYARPWESVQPLDTFTVEVTVR